MPVTLEEKVRAAAAAEAGLNITHDFARVMQYAEGTEELTMLYTMESRAIARATEEAEEQAVNRLRRFIEREPSWWERLLMRWHGVL